MSSFTARTLLSQCAKTRFRATVTSTNNIQRTWKAQQTVRTMATEQPQGQGRPLGALAHHTEKKQWKDLSTPEKGSEDIGSIPGILPKRYFALHLDLVKRGS